MIPVGASVQAVFGGTSTPSSDPDPSAGPAVRVAKARPPGPTGLARFGFVWPMAGSATRAACGRGRCDWGLQWTGQCQRERIRDLDERQRREMTCFVEAFPNPSYASMGH